MNHNAYGRLAIMFVLHVIAMYLLMYAMVQSGADIFPNYNQLYMAVLMASPMLLFELYFMRSMYPMKDVNMVLTFAGVMVLIGSFLLIRSQTAIGDEQLLKSMIPHHSGAIVMCREANIQDEQIKELCGNIMQSQQAEIDWMLLKIESLKAN